jgi:aminopeptidase N
VSITYEGQIHHALESGGEEYQRSFSQTPGIISEEGTMLSGSTHWVPWFGPDLVTYRLGIELPEGRDAVSQGTRAAHEIRDGMQWTVWDSPEPMDEIYLIEAAFTVYAAQAGEVNTYAYLRTPDPALAAKYLDATGQYITMYDRLIGPYPYSKFALVENFWETGYGMPSFTLLGPTIIRFPFILRSSYPHEILHNWWGNSVFVEYEKGNWCEGITAYLADHLLKEQIGQGAEYRRDTLQKFVNYVKTAKDFPLRDFRARHDAATEAIGYGKSAMFYHMLRMRLGDQQFVSCLKQFYQDFKFKKACFEDLNQVFSKVSGEDLGPFFTQWVDGQGAPDIRIDGHGYTHDPAKGSKLWVRLKQHQEGPAFELEVPVAVYFEGEEEARIIPVEMKERTAKLTLEDPKKILKLEVDPRFDVFRKLDLEETPPTLGQAFGAEKVLIILPESKKEGMQTAWERLASSWSGEKGGADSDAIKVIKESEIDSLPDDRAIWVFGRENLWRPSADEGLTDYGVKPGETSIALGVQDVPYEEHSFVMALRHPKNPDLVLCCLAAELPESIPGLGRKLPHYGKYSYLAFRGDEPVNVHKGQWPLVKSPMVVTLDLEGSCGKLPAHQPLIELPPLIDTGRLKAHVAFLVDDRLEGRGLGTPGLDEAADYIARCFQEYGLKSGGGEKGSCFQAWQENGGPENESIHLKNVIGIIPGTDPALENEPVVVGAHYDHLGKGWPDVHKGDEGKIHNGADDNASGVAVLLELARMLGPTLQPARPLVFVAFTGEEAGLKGSRHYVSQAKQQGASPFAMVNMDTVGRLEGKKLTVFGTGSAREYAFIVMGAGYTVGLETSAVPSDVGASDQVSFLDAGIPAVQLFSGPHLDYHRPTDDIEKLDFKGMAKVVEFAKEIVVYLADRKEPMDVKIKAGATATKAEAGGAPKTERRASLGTIPDFAFQGKGARIGTIVPGGAAEKAGLKTQDVITSINDIEIKDLRGYSNALKSFKPGEKVTVHILRGEEKLDFTVTLGER